MISGETVTVQFRIFEAKDAYGNEAVEYSEPITYTNVLVGRGDTVDVTHDGQPFTIRADRRFCFLKGFSEDLRGALITRDGITYQVVGEPVSVTEANLPSEVPWSIRAEAVRYDG